MAFNTTRTAFIGMVGAAAAVTPMSPSAAAQDRRPNIVFMIADQHRGDALGVAGAQTVRTPALDAFARSAVRFSRAYTTMALCSPARTSIMTGLYPHAHKIVSNTHGAGSISNEVSPEYAMWSELLQRAGYRAGYVGKWDVGTLQAGELADRPSSKEPGGMHRWTPLDYGFREALSAHVPYRAEQLEHSSPLSLKLALEQSGLVGGGRAPFYATVNVEPEASSEADVANKAIGMLRTYAAGPAKARKPFALAVSWASPHFPNYVPEPFASMYDPASIPKWASFDDQFVNKPYANKRLRDAWGVTGVPWLEWSRIVSHYYGMVTHVDAQIGRVITEVGRLGLGDDTIVIYMSDHGDLTGAHGLFNKGGVPYEELYHVPLMIRLPKSAYGGTVVTQLVRNMDIMPTIVEAAGQIPAPNLHARSLLPLIRGDSTDWYTDLMFEFHGDIVGLYESRILRNDRFKLVYSVADRNELYDLQKDPDEITNAYEDPSYRSVRSQLSKRLLAWMKDVEDPILEPARVILE